jgi:predicted MFS family arabinose efflux permease
MNVRVWAAALCFATVMGFSRLAYGALVPAMQADLGGPYALYGSIGGANFAGYLVGTILATRLARSPRRAALNLIALIVMSLAMAACGAVADSTMLGVLRFVVGVASAVGLVLTLGLAVEDVAPARRGLAAAVVWAGGAFGIAIVGAGGLVVPLDGSGWRVSWFVMGIAGVLAAIGFYRLSSGAAAPPPLHDDGGAIGLFRRARYAPLTLAYGLFGLGYICALTFFSASLAHSKALAPAAAWLILGSCGMLGARIWGPLVDRARNGMPMVGAAACCACGAVVTTIPGTASAVLASVLMGISFLGVPAMVGALLQQRESANRYPRAFASMTVVLGVGQVIGPILGGIAADAGGANAAMLLAGAALAAAALLALRYRPADTTNANETLEAFLHEAPRREATCATR